MKKRQQDRKDTREVAHRAASLLAADEDCLACDHPAPSEPCHYPKHRGIGGANAGWDPEEWVPLCRRCHDILDGRAGVSSRFAKEKAVIIMVIENEKRRGVWPKPK